MKTKQVVPSMARRDEDLNVPGGERTAIFDGYTVASYSPGSVGEDLPCTEVHLLINIPDVRFGLRLKSARALDELVGALLQHRTDVWGPK
jgi:hypothetical protein